eukprot:TRINITY_DN3154_c0_g5_i1.p1 TRINITY_DN3154_c0_g5~~TRINITY_DN3154_c0_g5_i1.p1  ORF type:complete len:872 (+),score=168.80 TRINITY_DN3154_c0_g5_i1:173-2788(+)
MARVMPPKIQESGGGVSGASGGFRRLCVPFAALELAPGPTSTSSSSSASAGSSVVCARWEPPGLTAEDSAPALVLCDALGTFSRLPLGSAAGASIGSADSCRKFFRLRARSSLLAGGDATLATELGADERPIGCVRDFYFLRAQASCGDGEHLVLFALVVGADEEHLPSRCTSNTTTPLLRLVAACWRPSSLTWRGSQAPTAVQSALGIVTERVCCAAASNGIPSLLCVAGQDEHYLVDATGAIVASRRRLAGAQRILGLAALSRTWALISSGGNAETFEGSSIWLLDMNTLEVISTVNLSMYMVQCVASAPPSVPPQRYQQNLEDRRRSAESLVLAASSCDGQLHLLLVRVESSGSGCSSVDLSRSTARPLTAEEAPLHARATSVALLAGDLQAELAGRAASPAPKAKAARASAGGRKSSSPSPSPSPVRGSARASSPSTSRSPTRGATQAWTVCVGLQDGSLLVLCRNASTDGELRACGRHSLAAGAARDNGNSAKDEAAAAVVACGFAVWADKPPRQRQTALFAVAKFGAHRLWHMGALQAPSRCDAPELPAAGASTSAVVVSRTSVDQRGVVRPAEGAASSKGPRSPASGRASNWEPRALSPSAAAIEEAPRATPKPAFLPTQQQPQQPQPQAAPAATQDSTPASSLDAHWTMPPPPASRPPPVQAPLPSVSFHEERNQSGAGSIAGDSEEPPCDELEFLIEQTAREIRELEGEESTILAELADLRRREGPRGAVAAGVKGTSREGVVESSKSSPPLVSLEVPEPPLRSRLPRERCVDHRWASAQEALADPVAISRAYLDRVCLAPLLPAGPCWLSPTTIAAAATGELADDEGFESYLGGGRGRAKPPDFQLPDDLEAHLRSLCQPW